MPKKKKVEGSKVKIGTILDKEIVNLLKQRAAQEGKAINSLIEDALLNYKTESTLPRELRLKALEQLLSTRYNIPDEAWRIILHEDYYDQ